MLHELFSLKSEEKKKHLSHVYFLKLASSDIRVNLPMYHCAPREKDKLTKTSKYTDKQIRLYTDSALFHFKWFRLHAAESVTQFCLVKKVFL